MKISPVGAEMFPTVSLTGQGQTDTGTDRYEEASSHFSEFCERVQKSRREITHLKSTFLVTRVKFVHHSF